MGYQSSVTKEQNGTGPAARAIDGLLDMHVQYNLLSGEGRSYVV